MEEAQEEVLMISSNNNNNKDQQSHNNNIVKGKRTKRQRPQSPVPFVVNSTIHDNTNLSSSPAVSSAEEFFDSTEEDEDMANCLILLAQCQSIRESPPKPKPKPKPKPAHYDIHGQEEIAQLQINNNVTNSGMKFNSRRFLEAPGTGTGKGGCYVYECKTCNRTFPSFQALGGHRASHKKPKAMLMNDDRLLLKSQHQQQQQFLVSKSDDEEEDGNFRNVSSLSLQLSNNNRGNNNNSSFYSGNINNGVVKGNNSKVHECSICGAEFTSGQALGGHMRRHRSAPVAATAAMTTTNTTLSLTPMAVVEAGQDQPRKSSSSSSSSRNNLLSLDLDLNLPAPEDNPKESKLPFSSKQQQQQQQQPQQQQKSSLVFTAAAALVDCHY